MKRVLLFLVVLVLTGLTATAAFADDQAAPAQPAPLPVTMTMATTPGQNGAITVTATVKKAGGGAVGNVDVNFTVTTDFFGKRTLALGSATTDSSGTAGLIFTPTWDGPAHFAASFAGNATYGAGDAATDLQLKSVQAAYTNAPPALASLRRTAGLGALALAGAVWVLLITVLVRVVAGVARGKNDPAEVAEELSAD